MIDKIMKLIFQEARGRSGKDLSSNLYDVVLEVYREGVELVNQNMQLKRSRKEIKISQGDDDNNI